MNPYLRWIAGAIVVGVPVVAVLTLRHTGATTNAEPIASGAPVSVGSGQGTPAVAATANVNPARVQVEASPDPSVYGLQTLLDFDTLDGADYDPSTKTLVLAGRTTMSERVLMVPYLHYLAGALDATAPTLSLEWLPESKQALDRAKSSPGFLEPKDASGKLTPFGVWLFHDVAGADVTAATMFIDAGTQLVDRGGFEKAFGGKGLLHVPAAIVPTTFPAVPLVRPIVKGMSPTSLLADVALEADVAGKSLVEAPGLAVRIPGYQPYSEWERTHGEIAGSQRVEIQPARFEVTESPDGRSMRFTRAEMRFTMEQMNGTVSTPRPSLTEYARLLSSQYDALAREVPVLHQLREAMKMLALVRWARRHGWQIDLPAAGRPSAPMPETVPGVVHVLLTIDVSKSASLKLHSVLWEAGGVDLRFDDDTMVVKIANLEPFPVVSPVAETNTELQRIAAHKTDVPLPEIPGWVKPATGGKDATAYLAIKAGEAQTCKDPTAVNRQLDVVKRKVAELSGYDRMIDAQTKSRVDALAGLQKLSDDAKTKRLEMYGWFLSKGGSLGLSLHGLRVEWSAIKGLPSAPTAKLMEYTDNLDKIGSLLDDANAASNRNETREDYWRNIAQELAKYVAAFEQEVRETQLSTWFTSRWIGARANLAVTLIFLLHEYGMRLADIQMMLEDTKTLDEQMRANAGDGKTIQAGRQAAEDAYLRERATLNQMLSSCSP